MTLLVMAATLSHADSSTLTVSRCVDLPSARLAIRAINLLRADVPQRHLLLQRIDVDVNDPQASRDGLLICGIHGTSLSTTRIYIGFGQRHILPLLVPLTPLIQRSDRAGKLQVIRRGLSSTPIPSR